MESNNNQIVDVVTIERTFGVHVLAIWMTRSNCDDRSHAFAKKAKGEYVQIDNIDDLSTASVTKLLKPDAYDLCLRFGFSYWDCPDIWPTQHICPCSKTTRQDMDFFQCLLGDDDLGYCVRVIESRDGFALAYFEHDRCKPDTSRTYTYKDNAGTTIKMHFDGDDFVVDSIEEGHSDMSFDAAQKWLEEHKKLNEKWREGRKKEERK